MPKQNPASPNSVLGKIAIILDQFNLESPTLSLAELTAGSKIPKTTVYRLLQEMMAHGFVTQQDGLYRPGLTLLRLGEVARNGVDPEIIFNDLLQPLAEATGETVITATLDKRQIVYLHVIESPRPLRFVAGAGARRSLPFGATGMALLAQLNEHEQRQLLKPPFPVFTDKTITELNPYLARLRQVEHESLVIDRGEYYDGIMAIAVPVPAEIPLTFTVVGPEERILPNQLLITTGLREAAAKYNKIGINPLMHNTL